MANCIRYFPKFAFDMSVKDKIVDGLIAAKDPAGNLGLIFVYHWVASIVVSSVSTVVCYPLDFARTRLGTDIGR